MAPSNEIILYHYTFSPYARRIVWYLNLRRIPYTQCLQPPIMPRPDLKALGVEYRRIPVLAIGRDVYTDTRLILSKLEALFPTSDAHPSISASTFENKAMEKLLEFWMVDGGIFARAAQLIPTNMPLFNDPKFTKDRQQFSGRSWNKDEMEAVRPEALVEIKGAITFLEKFLLADGREWIMNTTRPSLADIEAVWPFHWLQGMKGALPADQISAEQFPKSFAWINRFQATISAVAKSLGKPKTVKGTEAAALIGSSEFAEEDGDVDPKDPSGLKKGQNVEVWPIDTGFRNKDKGQLVALSLSEIVIETRTEDGKTVRVHAPRHGFRIRSSTIQSSKL